jgi:hypothetical protein
LGRQKHNIRNHKHDVISLKISSWTSKYINAEKTQQKRSRGYSEGQRGMQKLKFMYEYANILACRKRKGAEKCFAHSF